MRLVTKKSDRMCLRSCCDRQPVVGAMIDFADELDSKYGISCPLCGRTILETSFIEAKKVWNNELLCQSDLFGGLIYEGDSKDPV